MNEKHFGMRYTDSLAHHGILGQKWGIRRYQNPDGSLTPEGRARYLKSLNKKAVGYNVDKWGTDKKHNLLIVTGTSGSGKSTLANKIASKHNADVISLDNYFDNIYLKEGRSKKFDRYLNKHVPEYHNEIEKNFEYYEQERFNPKSVAGKKYWKTMDKVRDAMFDYSESQFGKQKIIAEGIQWLDTSLYPNRSERANAIKGKPIIVVKTGALTSQIRGMKRDEIKWYDPVNVQNFKMRKQWTKQRKQFEKDIT